MFESVREYVGNLQKDINSTRDYLYKLYGARRRLNNAINKADAEIKLFDNPVKFVADLEKKLQQSFLTLAKAGLFNSMLKATRINKEFGREPYMTAIQDAINSDKSYRLSSTGSGWSKIIKVRINLDASAGRLVDWSRAISLYRAELGIKIPRKNAKNYERSAQSASIKWQRIYNSDFATFFNTVKGRLDLSQRPAPFWQILDKGTVGLGSDRGGFPTPDNSPTNFVDEAEREINSILKDYLASAKPQYEENIQAVQKEKQLLQAQLAELDKQIQEVRFDVGQQKAVKSSLGVDADKVDDAKLQRAIQKAKQEINGIVNIGLRGNRVTTTYRNIRNLLRGV